MTVAIVVLSLFGVAAVSGVVLLAVKLSAALDNERASVVQEALANRAQLEAERERDLAVAALAQRTAERDAATAQLSATQKAIGAMAAKEAVYVHDAIATAVPDDAARLLDEQLSKPFVPGPAGTPSVTAAGRTGDAGATSLLPAGVAGPVVSGSTRSG